MNIPEILLNKYLGSEWTLTGGEYSGLEWLSDTPKPTKKELEDLWPIVQAEIQEAAQAKINAKASAIAKLEALGLTLEEVEAAFGLTS
jgi:hypothetical protein